MSTNMLEIRPFDFHSNTIRIVADDKGNPWFLANDVCIVLGYTNPRKTVADHCREAGVTKRDMGVVTGKKADGSDATQQVEVTFIDEGNLYRLIIKSRKSEAEPFERWVCDEVLPTIRKTGHYTQPKYALKDLRTKKAFPGGLTLEQQDSIKEVLRLRLENIPADKRAKASVTYWSALKSKFGVQTYKLIPPEHHTEAVSIAGRVTLEGELLPRDPDDTLSPPRRIPRAQHPGYAHARDHLNNLRAWGQDALPPRVHQEFDAELRELERSLISGWTEIDEALMRMAVSMAMLKRCHNGH